MRYGDLRWMDIETLDKDTTVVVCPLASLEQHGHHLPLLTDTYLVTEVAERIERQLGDHVALTPTLWLGSSDHHLDFPGTVSVPSTLYVEIIQSVARSFVRAGFRRILFLNGHGGNIAPGTVALSDLVNQDAQCERVLLALSSYWTLAGDAMSAEKHGMQSPQLTHACEYETSMMLACHETLVHLDAAISNAPVINSDFYNSQQGGRVVLANRFRCVTSTGAMGDPTAATRQKGESLLSAASQEVKRFLDDFLNWPLPTVLKP